MTATGNHNKRAIVTGASSGIGRQVVAQLVAESWRVLAVARRADRLRALADQLEGQVFPWTADVAADGSATAIIDAARDQLGGLDLLVNNAGTSWVGPMAQMPDEAIDEILNLNVRGLILMCRAAIPLLARSGAGQIINISSVAADLAMETLAVYCASKAAVSMFSRVLAKELAPQRIRVNTLSPCGTDTEIFAKMGVEVDQNQLVSAGDMARLVVLLTQLPEGLEISELITHKRFEP